MVCTMILFLTLNKTHDSHHLFFFSFLFSFFFLSQRSSQVQRLLICLGNLSNFHQDVILSTLASPLLCNSPDAFGCIYFFADFLRRDRGGAGGDNPLG